MKTVFQGTLRSAPRWASDFRSRDHLVPGPARLDPTQFKAVDSTTVTVGAGGVAVAATQMPVVALPGPIPTSAIIDFGNGLFVRTNAPAAAGATTVTIYPAPAAIAAGAVGTYAGIGMVNVPSGTFIGRTYAERDGGVGFGPAAATDDDQFLSAFDVTDARHNPDVELYRHNAVVKENYLPGWAGLAADIKAAIRDQYICQLGAE